MRTVTIEAMPLTTLDLRVVDLTDGKTGIVTRVDLTSGEVFVELNRDETIAVTREEIARVRRW